MRGARPSLVLLSLAIVTLAVWARDLVDSTGSAMATAASRLVSSLDAEKAAKIQFGFDDPERLNWHFIPRERKGLSIKAMNGAQRALAFGLIQTGLSASGYLKATTIMSLEEILREMEKGSGPVRDSELYFLSIFGTPSDQGKWGWRVEGHHLSLNFSVENGIIVSATPTFFGSNPGEVREGPRQGLRALAELEDRALRIVQALTPEQKKEAVVSAEAPKDVRSANTPQAPRDPAIGLAHAKLDARQKPMLQALIEAYAQQMPPDIGRKWLNDIRESDPDQIKFAWFGAEDRNQPHAYRVQGPSMLIEFNNTQNNANHIHSFWRSMLGDFGIAAKP